jgi:hypothetical protein
MKASPYSDKSQGGIISFGGRIILIVVVMLALSQALGTFLSVLSFEKIFLKALTSKYEILGKDIKRKIEQSLKFGKSLDRFVGMDRLVEPLFRRSKDIDEIFLSDSGGNILYTSGKAEFIASKGVTDTEHPDGKVLFGTFKASATIPIDKLFDWKEQGPVVRLYEGRYHVLFPIIPPSGAQKGILGLVFSQSVLEQKKRELTRSSRNKLAASVMLTAILIGLLVKLLFIAPTRRQVGLVTELMEKGKDESKSAQAEVPREVLEVQLSIADFLAGMHRSKEELMGVLNELEQIAPDNAVARYEIRLMKSVLEGKAHEWS